MELAALATWVATMFFGAYMFGFSLHRGRTDTTSNLPDAVLFSHPTLAIIGLGLWIAYLQTDRVAFAWIAFGVLLTVGLLGGVLLLTWLRTRRKDSRPADALVEKQIPMPAVVAHGALAVTTVVLVLATAITSS